MKRTLSVLFLALACATVVATQETPASRFEQARLAWDAGDYVTALQGLAAVLEGPEADAFHDRVALLTGELYQVAELTSDGRAPRFSPSGRYAAYEAGTRQAPVTRIADASSGKQIAEVPGSNLVFAADERRVAMLRVDDTVLASLRKEAATTQPAAQNRQAVMEWQRQQAALEARAMRIVVRDLASGSESVVATPGLVPTSPVFSADGASIYFAGTPEGQAQVTDIYVLAGPQQAPEAVTSGPGHKLAPALVPGGRFLVYTVAPQPPFGAGGGRPGGGAGAAPRPFVIFELATGRATTIEGSSPVVSANGAVLAFVGRSGSESTLSVVRLDKELATTVVKKNAERMASPALSPDGGRVAFETTYTRNTEVFCVNADGTGEIRVTREIQHDRAPRFLTNGRLIAIKGESRHSRAFLYDVVEGRVEKLFHNNTVRTIAPEYDWAASPDGTHLLIQAERDGDTISPERGVYLLDLTRKVTREALRRRIAECLAAEQALRTAGEGLFEPIAPAVAAATEQVSITRLFDYQQALFDFDSKYITQPGNTLAGEYLQRTFAGFGYQPEAQWFTAREGVRTANILATLRGTENPELVYVLSSHYDSNQRGPGADDNDSAIAVLLETARVLARTPMPATIVFAAFTGEEAGLLGSREYVRQAVEGKLRLVGALNNDMIGWCNDHRLDNTIRYSNAGIRDVQHAASFLFSRMITYDAHYFKSTDAAAYYEAYGDIVGGFGSYPVLGNPYYHQPTDLLETVNHELLVEATKANIASIMLLASSPSRIEGLKVDGLHAGAVDVSWTPSPEKGITGYMVAYGTSGKPMERTLKVAAPKARLPLAGIPPGQSVHVAVRAVTARGLVGWDWARLVAKDN